MQECNLRCMACDAMYYSASPKYAADLMICTGCKSTSVVEITREGEKDAESAHEEGS